ncbi:LysR family transcriptional regulator [Nocardioides currus]|uniref:LysR family transcriptional regulator n=1 Tax=Nocardioides currus TaxID=2133958 RepID=A0A2R7YSM8_9ACTN|nr:LysR family transcriptional regulator [Nocardioides currus]PUA79400.1 LysR family transcriptional regulator [Nocardioides currus]
MQIRDLEWLLAVADHEHVTDTAAILGISQPTLSRALARVEQELDAQLFERASDGVHLTPVGRIVARGAREVVARHDQLLADVRGELDPESGVARLAFLDSMATSLVPRLLRDFHAAAPRVRVLLSQEPGHELEADLARGAVDLAITSTRPAGHGWHVLQEERLVVAVPPSHRLAGRTRVRLEDLAGEELVTTPPGYGFRTLVDGLLRDAGVALDISFESQDLATIEGLVAAGLGVAIVPEAMVGPSGTRGLQIQGSPGARRTIGLTWRTDRRLPPAAERLRAVIVGRRATG